MTVQRTQLKRNVSGFWAGGLFRPIRSSEGYDPALAGDKDDVFDREIRRERNKKKALKNWIKSEERKNLDDSKSESTRYSLLQFVRSSGGLYFDEKSKDSDNGELKMLSFKESGKRGIAHKNGRYSLDGMLEQAKEAGFKLSSINSMLDALDNEIRGGKKIFANYGFIDLKENPAKSTMKKSAIRTTASNLAKLFKGVSVTNVIEHLQKLSVKSRVKKNPAVSINPAQVVKHRGVWKVKLSNGKFLQTYDNQDWKARKERTAKLLANTLNLNNADEQEWLDYLREEVKQKKYGRLRAVKNPSPLALIGLAANALSGALAGILLHKELAKKPKQNPVTVRRNHSLFETPRFAKDDFRKLLDRIENGELDKQNEARRVGKLAGETDNDVSRAIQYARIAYKLKTNPSAATIKAAESSIVKVNGLIGRALSRHRAGSLYKRQLRLESALERAKAKRAKAESKAKQNPSTLWDAQLYKGYWVCRKANGKVEIRATEKGRLIDTVSSVPNAKKRIDTLSKTTKNPTAKRVEQPRTKAKKVVPRRKMFETFQGRKATSAKEMSVSAHAPKRLDQLGDLVEIALMDGTILDYRKRNLKLCCNTSGTRLWIAGGKIASPNAKLSAKQIDLIAEIKHVVYGTIKPHLGDHKYTHYIHELGEVTGERPMLAADNLGFAVVHGGAYTIEDVGIKN